MSLPVFPSLLRAKGPEEAIVAILPIFEAPHPVLSETARPVNEDEFGADLEVFLSDMAQTMYAAPGVGLAAPQVGDRRRILVINPTGDPEDDLVLEKDGQKILVDPGPLPFLSDSVIDFTDELIKRYNAKH